MSNLALLWLHRAGNIVWAPILVVFITATIIITAPLDAFDEVAKGFRKNWGGEG